MEKKKRAPSIVRTDSLDLDPKTRYQQLNFKYELTREDYQDLDNQYKTDAITHKVVSKPAEDATRNGFRIVIPSDANLQQAMQKKLDSLNLQSVLAQQIVFQRSNGDGYLTIGVKELNPTSTDTPIDPQNLLDVVFVHAFGQAHIKAYQTNDDPTSVDYGKEQAIVVQPTTNGYTVSKNGDQIEDPKPVGTVVIDQSRYCHISLDKFEDDLHGTSVIQRCKNQIKNMSIATETVGKMLREFTFKIVKSDSLMGESSVKFRQDKEEMSQSLNTEATAFINSEDDIVKLSTPTNGINTLLDFAWQDLAAASNIPKSVLTGEQAGTLAGASQDVANYYDSVKATQEQELKPEIEKIVKLLFWAQDVGNGSVDPDTIDWHIEFNPLWTPDDKTMAQTNLINTQAAVARVSAGMQAPDEAMASLNGMSNNQIQPAQNMAVDSADAEKEFESQFTQEQVEQYKKDLEMAHNGKA